MADFSNEIGHLFLDYFLRHIRFKTITGISACYEFCVVSDRQWFPLLIPNSSEPLHMLVVHLCQHRHRPVHIPMTFHVIP